MRSFCSKVAPASAAGTEVRQLLDRSTSLRCPTHNRLLPATPRSRRLLPFRCSTCTWTHQVVLVWLCIPACGTRCSCHEQPRCDDRTWQCLHDRALGRQMVQERVGSTCMEMATDKQSRPPTGDLVSIWVQPAVQSRFAAGIPSDSNLLVSCALACRDVMVVSACGKTMLPPSGGCHPKPRFNAGSGCSCSCPGQRDLAGHPSNGTRLWSVGVDCCRQAEITFSTATGNSRRVKMHRKTLRL
jgi:hypothetical protein